MCCWGNELDRSPPRENQDLSQRVRKQCRVYRERLPRRPGLTGLLRFSFAPDTDSSSVQRTLAHDLSVENLSFSLEIRFVSATVLTLLIPLLVGRHSVRLAGLRGSGEGYWRGNRRPGPERSRTVDLPTLFVIEWLRGKLRNDAKAQMLPNLR